MTLPSSSLALLFFRYNGKRTTSSFKATSSSDRQLPVLAEFTCKVFLHSTRLLIFTAQAEKAKINKQKTPKQPKCNSQRKLFGTIALKEQGTILFKMTLTTQELCFSKNDALMEDGHFSLLGMCPSLIKAGSHCPLFFLETLGYQKTHLCYISPTIEDEGKFCLLVC